MPKQLKLFLNMSEEKRKWLKLTEDIRQVGCISQIWHPNWIRLAPNGTNLGLFKISFSTRPIWGQSVCWWLELEFYSHVRIWLVLSRCHCHQKTYLNFWEFLYFVHARGVNTGPKLGQIGPKWKKNLGLF